MSERAPQIHGRLFAALLLLATALLPLTGMDCPSGDGMGNMNGNTNTNGNDNNNPSPATDLFGAASALVFGAGTFGSSDSFIVVLKDPASRSGVVKADTIISRPVAPDFLAINSAGHLLSHEQSGIVVFATVTSFNNSAPSRTTTGITDGQFALDRDRDILYARQFDGTTGPIRAFHDTASASFDGAVQRNRELTNARFNGEFDVTSIFVNAADQLFVAIDEDGVNEATILVFDGASTLDGAVAPDREIRLPAFDGDLSTFFNLTPGPQNQLYFLSSRVGGSLIFGITRLSGADALNGSVTADATTEVSGYTPAGLVVSQSGTAYSRGTVLTRMFFAYDNIATLNGPADADRTFEWSEAADPQSDASRVTSNILFVD